MATKEVNLGSVRGPKGAAATVTVGKVTTGAAGSSASVTNSGTSGAAILNFTIPRGATGAQGNPTTVNGKSGASITLTAEDVGALPKMAYSTAEVNTGKTWIDGKPVYCRVYTVSGLSQGQDKKIAHGIQNLATVTDIRGVATTSNEEYGTYFLPLPYVSGSGASNIRLWVVGPNIAVLSNDASRTYSAYIVLEYTKSSD